MHLTEIVNLLTLWDNDVEFDVRNRSSLFEEFIKSNKSVVSKSKSKSKSKPKPKFDYHTTLNVKTNSPHGQRLASELAVFNSFREEVLPKIILNLPKLGLAYADTIHNLADIPDWQRRGQTQLRTAFRKAIPLEFIKNWLNGDGGQLHGEVELVMNAQIRQYAKELVINAKKKKPTTMELSEVYHVLLNRLKIVEQNANRRRMKRHELGEAPQRSLFAKVYIDGKPQRYTVAEFLVWTICMRFRGRYSLTPEEWSKEKALRGANRMVGISTGAGDAIADIKTGIVPVGSNEDDIA